MMFLICDLERSLSEDYIHSMTVIVDNQRRVTLPDNFNPGDAFNLEEKNGNRVVLTKLAEPPRSKIKLVEEGKYLVGVGSRVITQEEVRKYMDEFP